MIETCPHCGTALPEVSDAYCPECRNELAAHPRAAGTAPAAQPPPAAVAGPSPTPAVDPDAERLAAFWRTLTELTPRVYVVWVLIAINVAVFVLMIASGVSATKPTVLQLLAWGANFGPDTLGGEWWRLLTCTFVHIGIIHIAMNMWVLAVVGPLVARMVGNVGFLLLYLIAGLGGSLASLLWNPDIASAGASGAVFGVYGALLGLLQQQRGAVPPAALAGLRSSGLGFLGYNLIFGLAQPNIDMAAHLGGLAVGYVCGLVLSRPFTPEGVAARPVRNVLTVWLGVVFVVIGALGASVRHAGTAQTQTELEHFAATEEKVLDAYKSAATKFDRGEMTDAALADLVERDVLAEWRDTRSRLAALKDLPAHQQGKVAEVIEYMRLRQEGWELLVQALREGNQEKMRQAQEKQRRAQEAVKRLTGGTNGR